jgi:tetratricopeptide (TPR) repeat protein
VAGLILWLRVGTLGGQGMVKTIDSWRAVQEIGGGFRRAREQNRPSPYFFLIGAGVSAPQVPLASALEEDCRRMAVKLGNPADLPATVRTAMDRYGHWFQLAYPNPSERQQYLREQMESATVSQATFRLAHLLAAADPIANLVVTPNFDDLLSRVLVLFGKRPIICDHPATTPRIDPDAQDLQLVHVHGTYWFYDCCNLKDEIDARAESGVAEPAMAELLTIILSKRSPIVVGYSGWADDVIMSALRRRLSTGLGHNLYWFCHRAADIDLLPSWLTDHHNVFVVVPQGPPAAAAATATPDVTAPPSSQAASGPTTSVPDSDKGSGSDVLTAKQVFEGLIRVLDLPSPRLTDDPLGFFKENLETHFPKSDGSEDDLYRLATVIFRVEAAQLREHEGSGGIGDGIEGIRDALRRSHYRDAVRQALALDRGNLSAETATELVDMLWSSANGLLDDSAEELDAYRMVVEIGDAVARKGGPISGVLRASVAKALLYWAITEGNLQKWQESCDVNEQVVERYGDDTDPVVRSYVASALYNRAYSLATLERLDDALAVYEEAVTRFGADPNPELRLTAARSLLNKGVRLGGAGHGDDELAAYDRLIALFGGETDVPILEQVAMAIYNKALAISQRDGGGQEAAAVYDDVVARFGNSPAPELRRQVAMALNNKGVILGNLEDWLGAMATADEVVRRLHDATEVELRAQVAIALCNKADYLSSLGRKEEALRVYEEVLARIGGDTADPLLHEQAERAAAAKAELSQ